MAAGVNRAAAGVPGVGDAELHHHVPSDGPESARLEALLPCVLGDEREGLVRLDALGYGRDDIYAVAPGELRRSGRVRAARQRVRPTRQACYYGLMRPGPFASALALVTCALGSARADSGTLPKNSYGPDQLYQLITAPMSPGVKHNQPSVVNGWLMLAGNAKHELWNIHDPTHPKRVSTFEGPHGKKEAESHTVAFAKHGERWLSVTISGKGVDFWDLTDEKAPKLLSALELEGIDYGDNTEAVWGVFWQGRYVYVGGTNTGLHVVDAKSPEAPVVVKRIPTVEFGGVSAGPVFALGNLLIVTTPKESAGVATLDIGDPENPAPLDFYTSPKDSYIGGFFGATTFLLTPFRSFDVVSDPSDIKLLSSVDLVDSEYMSFGDDHLFLGRKRPNPGVTKYDISDPTKPVKVFDIQGRKDKLGGSFTDDQFPLPIGNLLVISDDEVSIGSTIAVHDTKADTKPPRVLYVNPKDGSSSQPVSTRIGISFSDQIDFRSVDESTITLRPLGGSALSGTWGLMQTLISFTPDAPLQANTTYEIVIPAGGVHDLSGNATAQPFSAVFSTGQNVAAPHCEIAPRTPTPIGKVASFQALGAPSGAMLSWDFGDGQTAAPSVSTTVEHTYAVPGRYAVKLTITTPDGSRSCTTLHVAHRPVAPVAPTRSSSVAVDEARRRVWVVNPDAGSVSIVDADSLSVLREVKVGENPRTVALAADGSAWVTAYDGDEVVVVSPQGDVTDRVAMGWGAAPFGVAFEPDGSSAWISLEAKGALVELDVKSRAEVQRVELGADSSPRALALFNQQMWVARFRSADDRGEVFELHTPSGSVVHALPLAIDPGPDKTNSGRGLPNLLGALTVSPDGRSVVVPAKKDNIQRGKWRDGEALNSDNTVRTMVATIDLDAGGENMALRVDLDNHDMASAVVTSPVGDLLFVTSQGTNRVDVLDAYSGKLIGGFGTGAAPQGLWLSQDGRLFVQSFMSRTLDVHDVSGLLSGTDTTAKHLASVATVAIEPLLPNVLLGKQIFYNAADPRMSLDGYLSCSTCHPDGRDDGRVWDFTDRGEGLRNTIALTGRGGTLHGPVHWTANFDEIQDFENDIRLHFGGGGLMKDADFDADAHSDPLGDPKAGLSQPLDALAAYVSSLNTFPRSPHRDPGGSMTADALEGRELFAQSGCGTCHSGRELTDSPQRVLHDVGTIGPASGSRIGGALTGLDTPTLRGLWASAPYLHDGSAATLDAVLENPAHGAGSRLSPAQRAKVVQFLLQLENDDVDLDADGQLRAGGGCGCRVGAAPLGPAEWWLGLLLLAFFVARRRFATTARAADARLRLSPGPRPPRTA